MLRPNSVTVSCNIARKNTSINDRITAPDVHPPALRCLVVFNKAMAKRWRSVECKNAASVQRILATGDREALDERARTFAIYTANNWPNPTTIDDCLFGTHQGS